MKALEDERLAQEHYSAWKWGSVTIGGLLAALQCAILRNSHSVCVSVLLRQMLDAEAWSSWPRCICLNVLACT